jgi:Tfp pilus assembly protein PilF
VRAIRSIATLTAVAALACACAAPVSEPAPTAPAVTPPSAPVQAPPPAPVAVPEPPRVTAESELDLGIKSYEDGDYKSADKQLASALDMGLASPADQARAHKYRAFMVCVNGREKTCRDEFRKALDADPNFALAPAEAGHPVWSQVVKTIKADMAKTKKK